jgi:8-oxo-dGTP diphosphatase
MGNFKITLKARLILYNRGKILLLKQTKPNGGNYTLIGGTIENEEFAKDSLIRESKEEAGLKLEPEDLQLVHVLHKKSSSEQRLTLYFKATRWDGKLRAREQKKFEDVAWFPLSDLPSNLTNTIRHVLREYRKGHMYSELKK